MCVHFGYMNHSWCSWTFLDLTKKKNSLLQPNLYDRARGLLKPCPSSLHNISLTTTKRCHCSSECCLVPPSGCELTSVLSSPTRYEVQMVFSSMCGPLLLSLTISRATYHPKHPQPPLDSTLLHTVHLFLKPPPLTFTLSPPPASTPLTLKNLVTFWHSWHSLSP